MGTLNLSWADIAILGSYFLVNIAIGLYFSRKNTDTEEYFLGGRSFPGWAIGLSLIGTAMSTVSFIAYPADSFKTTLIRLTLVLTFPLVSLFGLYVMLPFFRRGTISSAYGYLALRFGRSVSCYAALIFFIIQIIRVSSILYLTAILIQSITGLGFMTCMLLSGGITALYTVSGGFDAVIWTDVLQTITLLAGAVIMIGVILYNTPEGFSYLMELAQSHGKLSLTMDLNTETGQLEPLASGFSLSQKTFIMLLIAGAARFMNGQFDQNSVQRWCSAKSAKEARKSILVMTFSAVPIWALFMLVGTLLWAFFFKNPDPTASDILSGVRRAEEIVPYFLVTYIPTGWAGLVLAGALAAAMSSLSSSINAASMVWVRDIYKPYIVKSKSDRHYLITGFIAAAAVSALMMGGAYLFNISDVKTLNDLSHILISVFGGGMVAVFLLGVFTRLGDSRAVWIALVVNALFTAYILLCDKGIIPEAYAWSIDLYYSALVGNILTFIVAVLAGLYFKTRIRDFSNLTFWDQEKTPLV